MAQGDAGRAGTRPGGAEDACGVARPNAEGRIAEAREREVQERRDAIHREGMAAHDRAIQLILRYAELEPELVAIARGLRDAEATIAATNLRLAQEGDERRIGSPDDAARPQRTPGIPLQPVPIHHGLRLPSGDDGTRMAWPENVDVFGGAAPRELDAA